MNSKEVDFFSKIVGQIGCNSTQYSLEMSIILAIRGYIIAILIDFVAFFKKNFYQSQIESQRSYSFEAPNW